MSGNVIKFPMRLNKDEPLWLVLTADEAAELRSFGAERLWLLRQILLKKSILLSHANGAALKEFLRQIDQAKSSDDPNELVILCHTEAPKK